MALQAAATAAADKTRHSQGTKVFRLHIQRVAGMECCQDVQQSRAKVQQHRPYQWRCKQQRW
jgi:hypothetical protein